MKIFITGGSSGIGLATAVLYAKRGATVTIAARSLNRLEKASAGRFETVVLDVTDEESVARATSKYCAEHDGPPDILINCAGAMIPGEFITMPKSDFDENVEADFSGTVNMCRAFAPAMCARKSGHIVNVASVAGFLGIYGYTGYSAAKFAVMGFSEALRFELEPLGVSVNVVCPPDTDTPGLAKEIGMRPPETDKVAGTIKAISPELVAASMVKGIDKNKNTIIIGATSKLYARLKGLWPELFYWIVSSDVRKVQGR